MNKSFKKVLVTGTSLLMLAGVGASASQVTNPVHASRVSRLIARRNRDYRDIANINAQLAALGHHTATKRVRGHESLAQWYKNNARRLKWNDMHIKDFHDGFDDGSNTNYNDAQIDGQNNYTSPQYMHGWIVGYGLERGGKKVRDFAAAIHYYHDGVDYLKSGDDGATINLGNGEWSD